MAVEEFSQARGTTRRYGRTITADGRTALTDVFDGDETFEIVLWRGDDLTAFELTESAAAWDDAAAATWTLTLDSDDISDLEPGIYFLRVLLTDPGDDEPREVLDARLRVRGAPGEGIARVSYCTYDDMARYAGQYLERLQAEDDQTGFAEQRAEAKVWLDEQVLERAYDRLLSQAGAHGPVSEVDPIEITTGYDAGPLWGPSIYPDTTIRDQLIDIKDRIDDGLLEVDTRARRITSLYAIALVLEPQVGAVEETPYQVLASNYRKRAIKELRGWRARFHTTLDEDDVGDGDYQVVLEA